MSPLAVVAVTGLQDAANCRAVVVGRAARLKGRVRGEDEKQDGRKPENAGRAVSSNSETSSFAKAIASLAFCQTGLICGVAAT